MEHNQPNLPATAAALDFQAPLAADPKVKLKSPAEAHKWFADRGITISEWSMQRRYNPALVYQVLAGTRKAIRGTSFRIAVDLGLKALPVDDVIGTSA